MKKLVEFKVAMSPYAVGERAGFMEDRAKFLEQRKIVKILGDCKPVKKVEHNAQWRRPNIETTAAVVEKPEVNTAMKSPVKKRPTKGDDKE